MKTLGIFVISVALVSTAFSQVPTTNEGPLVAPVHAVSILYNFGSNAGDPVNPQEPGLIVQGRDGNLYSTTPSGGANDGGAVFRITRKGQLTVLYSFDNFGQASGPWGGLTLGTDGSFYGTTLQGGTSGYGTVFTITPHGNFSVLYSFTGGSDGGNPYAAPIEGSDGIFYGTTCGASTSGSVYSITRSGTFKTLHGFDYSDGSCPIGSLIQATDGMFYGTVSQGTSNGAGGIFKITPAGNFTVLHSFGAVGSQGEFPAAGLVQGRDGNFYGTTLEGIGSTFLGIIYRMTPAGEFTVLHNFDGSDGSSVFAGLVQATDGNLYGVSSYAGLNLYGTIFRISPKGDFSTVYNFDAITGAYPEVTPFQHTTGFLYGDTYTGGQSVGTFYRYNTMLKAFIRLLPTSGKVGKSVGIFGQGLKGTTSVSFNGTTAQFKIFSDTYLAATVPIGATSGFVTVTTASGALTSNERFGVKP